MGTIAFSMGLCATGAASLVVATLASISIAFVLPQRLAAIARLFVEWFAAISGAGYVALALCWRSHLSQLPPHFLGIVLALSYLPLCVMLLLRALEPQWPALVAGRAAELSFWHSAVAIFSAARAPLLATMQLHAARLLGDGALIIFAFGGAERSLFSFVTLLLSVSLFVRSISALVQHTGLPVYPPLFGPLPELPPRLRLRPQLTAAGRVVLQSSLVVVILAAILELGGLGILQSWARGSVYTAAGTTEGAISALGAAIRGVFPILVGAGLLSGLWLRHRSRLVPNPRTALAGAAVSPLWLAFPGVASLGSGWFPWLPLAVIGLATYVAVQDAAARATHAFAAVRSLTPGEVTAATAAGALGLPLDVPTGRVFLYSQALSTTATWFGAAALLAAIHSMKSALPAAHALVWGIMSGIMQLVSLWLRGAEPRPCVRSSTLPATLEALSHDFT